MVIVNVETKEKQESRKTVGIFATASFLHDMGSDIVFSVWPLYVTNVLGANTTILGLIDGMGDAVVSISQAVSGYLSDRIKKRKIFVWMGYLFGGLSRIGYALSPTWHWLIPFRLLDRSGKMRGSPRDAIVSEVSTAQNRGGNFGILRAMDNLGAVVGILISIIFLKIVGYRILFMLAAIPSVVAVLLILFTIHETKPNHIKIYKGIQFRDINANLRLFILISALFSLGSFSYSFLLLYANRAGFAATSVPILYLLFTALAALFSIPFGKLSDKIGRKSVLYFSFVLWAGVSVFFIFIHSFASIIAAFVLYGLHKGALDPVQKTMVSELAPKEFVASTIGAYQMVIGLCSLPASLIAGILWDNIGTSAPFYFSLYLTIIASILLVFVKEKKAVT